MQAPFHFDLLCFMMGMITGSGDIEIIFGTFKFSFTAKRWNERFFFLWLPTIIKYSFYFPLFMNVLVLLLIAPFNC